MARCETKRWWSKERTAMPISCGSFGNEILNFSLRKFLPKTVHKGVSQGGLTFSASYLTDL